MKWMYRLIGWYLRPSRVPVAVLDSLRAAPDGQTLDGRLAALDDEARSAQRGGLD